jgi:4-amino-4-deoxy-L-arabinose transferase-like glycosyltransferase
VNANNRIKGLRAWSVAQSLLWLIILGFALRLIVAQVFLGGLESEYQGDESAYVGPASHLTQGLGFTDNFGRPTSYRAPGLPLLVAIPFSVFGPDILSIRIFMCFLESLLPPAFYLLTRSVTGSTHLALIGGMMAMVFPTWIVPSGAVMTDVLTAVLMTLIAWMLIEGHRRHSLVWVIGSGIVWGAATVTRAGSLVYGAAIILWLLIVMPDWQTRLASIVAVTIPFALVLAPWSIRNTRVHGKFVPLSTQGGVQLYMSNNLEATGVLAADQDYFDANIRAQRFPNSSEAERDKLFHAEAVRFIRENPQRFVELCFIRFGQLWKLYSARVPLLNSLAVIASFGLALPFFLLQIIRCGWRRGPELLFVLIILCHMGLHMVYGAIVRYRMPIEPLVMVMAITGFCWTLKRFQYRYRDNTSPLSLNVT